MYVAALRALSEHCEYGDSLKLMLRDRLVCGINHEGIQRRLLSEKYLTFDNALEIALAMEAAAKDTKDLQSASSTATLTLQLHYAAIGLNSSSKFRGSGKATQLLHRRPQNKSQTRNTRANPTCYHCGATHLASEYRFINVKCRCCKKIPPWPSPRPTHYMQEDDIPQPDQDSTYELFIIKEATRDPILITVELNNIPVELGLDTRASLNLINRTLFNELTQEPPVTLQHSTAQLQTYTGESVNILGMATVQVKYGENYCNYQFM